MIDTLKKWFGPSNKDTIRRITRPLEDSTRVLKKSKDSQEFHVKISYEELYNMIKGATDSNEAVHSIINAIEIANGKTVNKGMKRNLLMAISVIQREMVKNEDNICTYYDTIVSDINIPSLDIAIHSKQQYKDWEIGSYEIVPNFVSTGLAPTNFMRKKMAAHAASAFDYVLSLIDGFQRTSMTGMLLGGTYDGKKAYMDFTAIKFHNGKFISKNAISFYEHDQDAEAIYDKNMFNNNSKKEKDQIDIVAHTFIPSSEILNLKNIDTIDDMELLLNEWISKKFVHIPNNDYDYDYDHYLSIMFHLQKKFLIEKNVGLNISTNKTLDEMHDEFDITNSTGTKVKDYQIIKGALAKHNTSIEEELLSTISLKLMKFGMKNTMVASELGLRLITNTLGITSKFNGSSGLKAELEKYDRGITISNHIFENRKRLNTAIESTVNYYMKYNTDLLAYNRFLKDEEKMTIILPLFMYFFYTKKSHNDKDIGIELRIILGLISIIKPIDLYLSSEKSSRLMALANIMFTMLNITKLSGKKDDKFIVYANETETESTIFDIKSFTKAINVINAQSDKKAMELDGRVYSLFLSAKDMFVLAFNKDKDTSENKKFLSFMDYIGFNFETADTIPDKVHIDHALAQHFFGYINYKNGYNDSLQDKSKSSKKIILEKLKPVNQAGEMPINKSMNNSRVNVKKKNQTMLSYVKQQPDAIRRTSTLIHYHLSAPTSLDFLKFGDEVKMWHVRYEYFIKEFNTLNNLIGSFMDDPTIFQLDDTSANKEFCNQLDIKKL